MLDQRGFSLSVAILACGAPGCSDTADPVGESTSGAGGGGAATSTPGSACGDAGVLSASVANNYTFSSALSFPLSKVAPEAELRFDWSALSRDFLTHPLDPVADIDAMYLMLWFLTPAELEEKLNNDELRQSDLAVIAMLPTDNVRTSGSLFEVQSAAGQPLGEEQILPFMNAESYAPAEHTYTVMVATGDELGAGTRMIHAFQLDPNSLNTDIELTNTSASLAFEVDLATAPAARVRVADPALVFDWSSMPTNALGAEFVLTRVTDVVVARFDRSRDELYEDFLGLINYAGDIVADEVFRASVPSGSSLELSTLANDAGVKFGGIDETSTWALALFCGRCRNPAPWYLTFLSPCQ